MTQSPRHWRKFGLLMGGAFLIIALILIWRHRWTGPYFAILAGFFLLSGLLLPRILSPLERVWMAFAHVLGVVMTYILLTITFFVVITPVGFFIRLIGKDLLERKFDSQKQSYWVAVEPDGPCSRPDKPY
jgi:hypothetical protein